MGVLESHGFFVSKRMGTLLNAIQCIFCESFLIILLVNYRRISLPLRFLVDSLNGC